MSSLIYKGLPQDFPARVRWPQLLHSAPPDLHISHCIQKRQMIFAFFCGHQINLGRIFSCQISFINLLCPVLATCLAAKEILSDSAFSVQHLDFYNLTVFKITTTTLLELGSLHQDWKTCRLWLTLEGKLFWGEVSDLIWSDLRLLLKTEIKSLLLTLAIMLFDDHLWSYQYCIDHSAQDCSV